MIVFDLRCGGGHVFEAWFATSSAYQDQLDRRLLSCPICGDQSVGKAVMAPNVSAKGDRASPPALATPSPDVAAIKTAMAVIAKAQAAMLEKSRWVGGGFADQARAMHLGERPVELIHGQATRGEAQALAEEGVAVAPLLVPIVPPEACN